MKLSKTIMLTFALAIFILTSCSNSQKSNNETSDKSVKTINGLFFFAVTEDDNFCNPDSIVSMECGGGYLYFTKFGNVIRDACYVPDTSRYDIGSYNISGDSIFCVFNRNYSFFCNEGNHDEQPKPYNINSGVVRENSPITFKLCKIKCDKFEYSFITDKKENNVLRKCDNNETFFWDKFRKIKALSAL